MSVILFGRVWLSQRFALVLPLEVFLPVGFPLLVVGDRCLGDLVEDVAADDEEDADRHDVFGGQLLRCWLVAPLGMIVLDVVARALGSDGPQLCCGDCDAVGVRFQLDAEDVARPWLGSPVLAQAARPVIGDACVEQAVPSVE